MDEKKLTQMEWETLFGKLNRISDDTKRNELIDDVLGKDVGQCFRDGTYLLPMTLLEANISNYRLPRAVANKVGARSPDRFQEWRL